MAIGWNDPTEAVVGGTGEVYIAATGSSLPTTEDDALAPSIWHGLGYHSEDGVSVNQSVEIQRFGAWQTKHDIRRQRGNETFQITFSLLQWNEDTTPFAFGGGSVTSVDADTYKYTPPADIDAIQDKSLVCDVKDGSSTLRFVIPKGNVVEAVDSQFTREAIGMLPITFEALQPDDGSAAWYVLTNLTGFATGS